MKEEKNKNNTLIIVLVLVIIVLVFIIGFMLGTRKVNDSNDSGNTQVEEKKEKKKETKEEENEKEKVNEKEDNADNTDNTSLSNIDEISSGIPKKTCGGYNFPFKEKDVYLKDLSSELKLSMLTEFLANTDYKEIDSDFNNQGIKKLREFTEKDVEKYFEDTNFLGNLKDKLELSGFNGLSKIDGKYYLVMTIGGCEGPQTEGESITLVDSKKEGNILVLTYRYYSYVLPEDTKQINEGNNAYFTYDYYKDSKKSKVLAKGLYKDEQLESYYDQMNTYDFYYDVSDGNMRFVKMIFNQK